MALFGNGYLEALKQAGGLREPERPALSYLDRLRPANNGLSSEEARKRSVWATTRPLNALTASYYPAGSAFDEEGSVICFSHYGKCDSQYGWEIDHRTPTALGGLNVSSNLRALHWKSNRRHGGILGGALRGLR